MGKKTTQGHLSSIITSPPCPPPNEPNRLSSEITLCKAFSSVFKSPCFPQPFPSFYRLLEGQGWNGGAWQDPFFHWWKGRCTRAVVTLVLQLLICIIAIIMHFQLKDFNRDNVKQNKNVHWRIFLYSGIGRYKCLMLRDGYGSSRQSYRTEQDQ